MTTRQNSPEAATPQSSVAVLAAIGGIALMIRRTQASQAPQEAASTTEHGADSLWHPRHQG